MISQQFLFICEHLCFRPLRHIGQLLTDRRLACDVEEPALTDAQIVEHLGMSGTDVHRLRVESNLGKDIREAVSRALADNGFGLLSLATADLSLEDIFVQLVTGEDEQ